jgi:hypothetical protein
MEKILSKYLKRDETGNTITVVQLFYLLVIQLSQSNSVFFLLFPPEFFRILVYLMERFYFRLIKLF